MLNEENLKAKVIAFYLPQFHAIPENDESYGKGFTEWTNTKKAKPLFENHYQPRTPLNENYYNLLDESVMRNQAEIAKKYGVYGFCYYHYWFKNGKKLLEKPVENMLADPGVDIPFCLSWANENWTRKWDGGNNGIVVEQDYGGETEWENHFQYLLPFFQDERYIKIDGKPLFLIYKPGLIPNCGQMLSYMRKRTADYGFPGLYLCVQHPDYIFESDAGELFDRSIQFEPLYTWVEEKEKSFKSHAKKLLYNIGAKKLVEEIAAKRSQQNQNGGLIIRNYDEDWNKIIARKVDGSKYFAGGFVDWDNTPRNVNGLAYQGATPEKFGAYFKKLVCKVNTEYDADFIFVNAWNEWAEGAFLEPDEKYGYGYLEQLQNAISDGKESSF